MTLRSRRAVLSSLGAALLVAVVMVFLAVPAGAATPGVSGPVLIKAPTIGSETVEVSFAKSTPADLAKATARAVLRAAGVTPGQTTVTTDSDPILVDVRARLSDGDGFLRWRIPPVVVSRIAQASGEPVEVQLVSDTRPSGSNLALISGGLSRRYRVPPGEAVGFGVLISALVGYLLVIVAASGVCHVGLRRLAERTERRMSDKTQAVQRLRVLSTVGVFAGLLLLPLLLLTGWGLIPGQLLAQVMPGVMRARAARIVAIDLGLFVPYVIAAVAAGTAVRPAYARLRDLPGSKHHAARQTSWVLIFVIPPAIYGVIIASVHGIGAVVAPLLYIGAIWAFLPLVMMRLLRARPADDALQHRIATLLADNGVRVHGVRVMEGRSEKTANALVLGLLPQLRYVVISDYLLDNFDNAEVEAVVAHEAGHLRHHHLLKKMGAIVAGVVVGALVFAAVAAIFHLSDGLTVAGGFVALIVGVVLIPGLIGVRLEERADDFAAEAVGSEPLRRALAHLAELNMTPTRTGRSWNLLTQHPGIEQRLRRLAALDSSGRESLALRGPLGNPTQPAAGEVVVRAAGRGRAAGVIPGGGWRGADGPAEHRDPFPPGGGFVVGDVDRAGRPAECLRFSSRRPQ